MRKKYQGEGFVASECIVRGNPLRCRVAALVVWSIMRGHLWLLSPQAVCHNILETGYLLDSDSPSPRRER